MQPSLVYGSCKACGRHTFITERTPEGEKVVLCYHCGHEMARVPAQVVSPEGAVTAVRPVFRNESGAAVASRFARG